MGIIDSIKGQFVDVIEFVDPSNKIIVQKYVRETGDNEIKQGSKVIVREGQAAIFLKGGQLADVLLAGTHTLTTDNLPFLSTLDAIGHGFNSPIKADLYFVNMKQFIGNKWGTKNPIILQDKELGLIRVRAFGTFAFRIINAEKFMKEVFGTKEKVLSYDIIVYLTSFINEAIGSILKDNNAPFMELASQYNQVGNAIEDKVNVEASKLGVEFSNVIIENISLPDEVQQMIDKQSSIGIASKNMDMYQKFESIQAMRDAAKQENGLAGLGASMAIGNQLANNLQQNTAEVKIKCTNCGAINEEKAKFCQECGSSLSVIKTCGKCGAEQKNNAKFCVKCGNKLD